MRRVACLSVAIASAGYLAGSAVAPAQEAEVFPVLAEPATFLERLNIPWIADARAQATESLPSVIEPSDELLRLGDVLAFAGIDGWRFGGSTYAGGETLLATESQFDVILRVFGANGVDDFRTPSASYRSDTARASVLPGLRYQSEGFDIKIFAGGDYEMRVPLRPAIEVPTQFFGGRAAIDVWWEPSEQWMLSGSAAATTIEQGVSARVAAGWRWSSFGWIGPEVLALHDVFNTQWRAGAHFTGLKVGETEWSIAGGFSRDSFGRGSPYARIGVTLRP